MASAPASSDEEGRGVRYRGLPAKDRVIDPKRAAQIEAERLRALAPGTYRHPDGSPPARPEFEAFARQYDQMTNEQHVWRFARPDGSTYETSWRGLGTGTTAQATADVLGHRVIGEVSPRSGIDRTPTENTNMPRSEARLTPPPLVQAQLSSSPPPPTQADHPLTQPPLVQAEPLFEPLPWPYSKRIDDHERSIESNTKALSRSPKEPSAGRSTSQPPMKPTPGSLAGLQREIGRRILEYRDIDPPPRLATEKLKPVHNITAAHQEKVRDLVNWAIQSAALEAHAGTEANMILKAALTKIADLRTSKLPDAADNLIYRDADHYLAARTQEFMTTTARMLNQAGLISAVDMMRIATTPPSRETNEWAAGPMGANQLYENMKLQKFAHEAHSLEAGVPGGGAQSGPVGEHSSAAGGTEWELLGMIDFERYDSAAPKALPHPVVDLPGKGESLAGSPEVPAYLRSEAKRIVEKMEREAKFTK
jgi:hypothetical protein